MTCIEFQHSQGSAHRFCGTDTFPVPEFYSHDRTAIVTFKSDEYRINNGVRFTYQATGKLEELLKKSSYHSLCWFHTVKSNTKICKALHVFVFLSPGCSREYNQPFGYLKSPGWPGRHPNNMDCSIVLRAPQNHTISLFFHAFSLEDSIQCSHDFLEVLSQYIYFVGLNRILLKSKDINSLRSSTIWTDIRNYYIATVLWWKILRYYSKRLNNTHYTKSKTNKYFCCYPTHLYLARVDVTQLQSKLG